MNDFKAPDKVYISEELTDEANNLLAVESPWHDEMIEYTRSDLVYAEPFFSSYKKLYTGLKDWNNNPIVEGDIVQTIPDASDDSIHNTNIFWSFTHKDWYCSYPVDMLLTDLLSETNVLKIGSIYDKKPPIAWMPIKKFKHFVKDTDALLVGIVNGYIKLVRYQRDHGPAFFEVETSKLVEPTHIMLLPELPKGENNERN